MKTLYRQCGTYGDRGEVTVFSPDGTSGWHSTFEMVFSRPDMFAMDVQYEHFPGAGLEEFGMWSDGLHVRSASPVAPDEHYKSLVEGVEVAVGSVGALALVVPPMLMYPQIAGEHFVESATPETICTEGMHGLDCYKIYCRTSSGDAIYLDVARGDWSLQRYVRQWRGNGTKTVIDFHPKFNGSIDSAIFRSHDLEALRRLMSSPEGSKP
jgi:hypothetical protein